ncbi:MAG: DNA recombination protein RmuC [Actinomycetota bacterium]
MEILLFVLIGVVVGVVVGAAIAGVLASRAARPTTQPPEPPPIDVADVLHHLVEHNRSLIESERERTTTELDGKKSLIDQQLATMTGELDKVAELVRGIDAERKRESGALANELRRQHEGLTQLNEHTQHLREALASQKVRGQWGERMAEDVLALAGFLEGVNYKRQATLEGSGGRPDYTFLLPNGLVLHMDVKFPLDNYVRFLEAQSELERRRFQDQFLRDVRNRVRELTARGYLDDGDETVDCLLLFIPNEQVYAFVHEHDGAMLDEALRNKVVLCSPLTLYAVLAVVRQAVDNFRLEKTSNQILSLLGEFSRQWEKYVAQLDKVQQRFDQVAKDYGALMTTRHRALQRPLDRIEALGREGPHPLVVDGEIPPLALDA